MAEQDPKAGPVARFVTAVWEFIQNNLSFTMQICLMAFLFLLVLATCIYKRRKLEKGTLRTI